MNRAPVLKPGANCWRLERADRVAFLVDGADYFHAFREAVKQARRSVLIMAWDIDSRVKLVRGRQRDPADDLPDTLGDFLNAMVRRRKQLNIHVLDWDFIMLFAPDREWLPLYKREWSGHRRLHFALDDMHPGGACHHQKIVVVDDRVAFAGGLDLTLGRWDTTEHRTDDPIRRELDGEPIPQPYHDVQIMVSGPAAAALGDLARERWFRATGRRLEPPRTRDIEDPTDPWPAHIRPDIENVELGIARTEPEYGKQPEVREVEQLLLDSIASARESIYIEAQYFSARKVGEALLDRLQQEKGPEVVVLLPEHTTGWLSQKTMDVLRERMFKQLMNADREGRLRLYAPCVPGLGEECVNVHSKVTIIDDELVRVGSANLNNRSMGLDTECDIAIEANGREDVRRAIAAFRNRLLGEHLGMEPARIEQALAQEGSLIRAIESLRGPGRSVRPLTLRVTADVDALVPDEEIVDPARPFETGELVKEFVPEAEQEPTRRHLYMIGSILAAVAALAAAWHWSPLRELVDVPMLVGAADEFGRHPAAPLLALGVFVAAGLISFPLSVLIIVCALVFGPWQGFLYALAGALLSAACSYALGRLLGRRAVRRVAGRKLRELDKRLARRGLLTIIVVRIVPLAPFSVINLVAGTSRIRFRDFMLGSAIGLLPGLIIISLFTDQLAATIRKPDLPAFAILAAVLASLVAGGWAFWQWGEKKRDAALRTQSD